jgi:hypothetical protein
MKEQRVRVFQREKREKKDRVRDIQKEEGETLWERHKQPQKIKISKSFFPLQTRQTDREREERFDTFFAFDDDDGDDDEELLLRRRRSTPSNKNFSEPPPPPPTGTQQQEY